jgi:hypothetical protein
MYGGAQSTGAPSQCGQQLERAWRAASNGKTYPRAAYVQLMMYTFAKTKAARAEKRIERHPEMIGNPLALGTGPGGVMLVAQKTAQVWRDPPSQWFVTTCDIAIEARSSFVELAVISPQDIRSPIFVVRASTGVPSSGGFLITQQPLIQETH